MKFGVIFVLVLTFSSCSTKPTNIKSTKINGQSVQVKVPIKKVKVQSFVKIPTTKEIVDTLCSNGFEGRLTGSKGNVKAGEYIENIFNNLGLNPLFGKSY